MHGDNTSTLKDLIATWINQDFYPCTLLKSNDKHTCSCVHNICRKLLCPSEWDWGDDWWVSAFVNHYMFLMVAQCEDYHLWQNIISENSWPLFLYKKYAVNLNNLEQGLFKSRILVQVSCLLSCRLLIRNLMLLSRKSFGKNHHEDLTPEVVSLMSVTVLAEQKRDWRMLLLTLISSIQFCCCAVLRLCILIYRLLHDESTEHGETLYPTWQTRCSHIRSCNPHHIFKDFGDCYQYIVNYDILICS